MTIAAAPGRRVLIVEDEAVTALDLSRELAGLGYDVCGVVDTSAEAVRLALETRPDVVLMDVRLADGGDGIDTAREIARGHDTAVVFLTAHSDEATLERALDVSPFGFLIKPFRARDLKVAIELARAKHAHDVAAVRDLHALASTDPLTGLANRRHLDTALHDAWTLCRQQGRSLAVVLADIDHFKDYNDSSGHLAGDTCLATVAGLIRDACSGPEVVLGRWGGEEFLVILPDTDLDGARAVAERLVHAVGAARLPTAAPRAGGVVTVSAGVAALPPEASGSAHALLELADGGLYAAKTGGRNRVAMVEQPLGKPLRVAPDGPAGGGRLLPLPEGSGSTMAEQLASLHRQIARVVPQVDQIACVLYDPGTDMLKTYVESSHAGAPLQGYEFPLAASRSLSGLARTRRARIIDDLPADLPAGPAHTAHIRTAGFRSSYTVPLFEGETFQGFLFMDSLQPAVFTAAVTDRLAVYVNLVRLLVCQHLTAMRALAGSVHVAREFVQLHDVESARHLERMARYARLIARQVAPSHGLGDEFVEQVFLFAPLHDVGKLGIPDRILHKPESLTAEERAVVATHVAIGIGLVENLIGHFRLGHLAGIEVLRNIVAGHHELLDGSGYPRGLRGDAIPLEARIVTVADIFDALCSQRDYKAAWSMDDALRHLQAMAAAGKIDGRCVAGLAASRQAVEPIMRRYAAAPQPDACPTAAWPDGG